MNEDDICPLCGKSLSKEIRCSPEEEISHKTITTFIGDQNYEQIIENCSRYSLYSSSTYM